MARHTISAEKYSEAELAGLIEKALQGGKGSRLPLILSAAAAVILLAVGGLFLWRNQPAPVAEATPEPTAEPTPAPTEAPTPTPKPTVEGIDLDLSLVAEVVYVGDTFKYYSMFDGYHMTGSSDVRSYRELAYESWENGTLRFYSTENGQEIPMGELGDISYLKLLPNLLYLTFVNVKGEIPDLSKSFNLNGVTIINCDIPDIQGLAGCGMDQFHYEGGSVKDFSPLNDCARLQNADISPWGDPAGADFSDFHPAKLSRLSINGSVDKLGGIAQCKRLRELKIFNASVADLSCLEGLELQRLELDHLERLTSLNGLQQMKSLNELSVQNCIRVSDISALEGCTGLNSIHFGCDDAWMDYLTDVSVLGKLPKLQNIDIFGVNTPNLDFLKELRLKKNINLGAGIAWGGDFSGLAAIDTFSRLALNVQHNYAAVAPYVEGKTVRSLALFDAGTVDFSRLPNVTSELELSDCLNRDLSGMPEMKFGMLRIRHCRYLSSFSGLENLAQIGRTGSVLTVDDCPRLADWSGIEGKTFYTLELKRLLTLPDFTKIRFRELTLEYMGEDVLPDLGCLSGLDTDGRYNFRFANMDQIRDLSPLFPLYGHSLAVPPQVGEQAQGLVDDGHFNVCEIIYPEGGWDPNQIEVNLLSLEELDTLPPSILKHVKNLEVVGDELVDWETTETYVDWSKPMPPVTLRDRETGGEKTVDRVGTLFTDLSRLSVLTGLESLTLEWQPLESLDGIQALENLRSLKVEFCPKLTDVSSAFTVQGLRSVDFQRCPVSSLQGIQNLYDLESLDICSTDITSLEGIEGLSHLGRIRVGGTNIRDFSPLAQVDFTYAAENLGGVQLTLNVMNSRQLPEDAFALLDYVPYLARLEMHDIPTKLWLGRIMDKPVRELECDNADMTQDEFNAFVEAHPELEQISVAWNQKIKDVSILLTLENLNEVRLSQNMPEAARSLGDGFRFELRINN